MAAKIQAQIKEFEQIAEILKVIGRCASSSPETSAAANAEADALLEKFSQHQDLERTEEIGRRVYDDKEFYVLSPNSAPQAKP